MYQRRSDEYGPPSRRLLLQAEFPEPSDRYLRYIRGSSFHQHVAVPAVGSPIELELVPETFNPWDANALATDVHGHRFGYVPAEDALLWHDVVRAANRSGFAVWSCGEVATHDEGSGSYLTATLSIPLNRRLNDLADRFGLGSRIDELLALLDPGTRDLLLEVEIWYGVSNATVDLLTCHANEFPELTWPTRPARPEQLGDGLPGVLVTYLRNRTRQESEARRIQRAAERDRLRRERQAQRDLERQLRDQQKRQEACRHRELVADVELLLRQGWTTRAVADHLGVSVHLVTETRRKMPDLDSDQFNAAQAAERRARADRAMALQVAGKSRKQIAAEMGIGFETVVSLLRDAKFYARPDADPQRLAIAHDAHRARSAGEKKAAFRSRNHLSAAKSSEAWRDAEALFE